MQRAHDMEVFFLIQIHVGFNRSDASALTLQLLLLTNRLIDSAFSSDDACNARV